jgi:hypothetical protein
MQDRSSATRFPSRSIEEKWSGSRNAPGKCLQMNDVNTIGRAERGRKGSKRSQVSRWDVGRKQS